jgi:hypothetical protein
MDADESLLWLSAQSPEARKAIGFVHYYLDPHPSLQVSQDDAYISGWDEAEAIGARDIPLACANLAVEKAIALLIRPSLCVLHPH